MSEVDLTKHRVLTGETIDAACGPGQRVTIARAAVLTPTGRESLRRLGLSVRTASESTRTSRTLLLRVCRSYLLPSTHIPWWHGLGRELPPERWPLVEALADDTPLALLTTAWCVHVFE